METEALLTVGVKLSYDGVKPLIDKGVLDRVDPMLLNITTPYFIIMSDGETRSAFISWATIQLPEGLVAAEDIGTMIELADPNSVVFPQEQFDVANETRVGHEEWRYGLWSTEQLKETPPEVYGLSVAKTTRLDAFIDEIRRVHVDGPRVLVKIRKKRGRDQYNIYHVSSGREYVIARVDVETGDVFTPNGLVPLGNIFEAPYYGFDLVQSHGVAQYKREKKEAREAELDRRRRRI